MNDVAIELLERYRDGEVAAMGELVELYRRPLYGFILRMTEGRGDADEVFQEVWFRAIEKIDSFGKGNFLSWLFRIAHNLIIDNARRNMRFSDPPATDGNERNESAEEMLKDPEADPSALIEDRDTGDQIRAALKQLPLDQREVFLMRIEGDLKFREIAHIQGVSINTALARMQYALERLRRELRDVYEDKVVTK